MRCPGPTERNWKPGDVSEVVCPKCRKTVEVWPNDPPGVCPHCKSPLGKRGAAGKGKAGR
jgi:predicted amidophosphoribosyltransferase